MPKVAMGVLMNIHLLIICFISTLLFGINLQAETATTGLTITQPPEDPWVEAKKNCQAVEKDYFSSIKDAQKSCANAKLDYTNCKSEFKLCKSNDNNVDTEFRNSRKYKRDKSRRGRKSEKFCKTNILLSLKSDQKLYKEIREEAKDADQKYKDEVENSNNLQQLVIDKENELADAKLSAEQVVRDSAKENARMGQEATQRILTTQLQIDKIKFEIEDLKREKTLKKLEANNAIEDAEIKCYQDAVARYDTEYNECIVTRNARKANGTLQGQSLNEVLNGSRKGSCKKENVGQWHNIYAKQCETGKTYIAQINRVKVAYNENLKSINTNIKRKFSQMDSMITQMQKLETDNQSINKQLLDDQKAALQRANNRVQSLFKELGALRKRVIQAQSSINNANADKADFDRQKFELKDQIAASKAAAGSSNINAEKANDAFSALNSINTSKDALVSACCGIENRGTLKNISNQCPSLEAQAQPETSNSSGNATGTENSR